MSEIIMLINLELHVFKITNLFVSLTEMPVRLLAVTLIPPAQAPLPPLALRPLPLPLPPRGPGNRSPPRPRNGKRRGAKEENGDRERDKRKKIVTEEKSNKESKIKELMFTSL